MRVIFLVLLGSLTWTMVKTGKRYCTFGNMVLV
jgi:hypothetical protein